MSTTRKRKDTPPADGLRIEYMSTAALKRRC